MDWDKRYLEIAKKLNLDIDADLKATKILDGLLDNPDLDLLSALIVGRSAIVLGTGPSLMKDIQGIKSEKMHRDENFVLLAADGAVKALLNEGILPEINITDLDGDINAIIRANRKGTITVVHAHGDNIRRLEEVVPKLKSPIGTTQTKPLGKVQNFGGFTDGDRAVFLAEKFNAELIALAGMDFGREIGEFSGNYDKDLKLKKLEIGKKLLEELARESDSMLVNLTKGGEDLAGIPRISAGELRKIV